MIDELAENARTVDSYGLVLPDPWVGVPIDPDGQRASADDARRQLRQTEGWTKTHDRRLDVAMAHYNDALAQIDASFAATYLDLWPAQRADDDAAFVSASCAVGTFAGADVDSDVPLTAASLLVAASSPRSFEAVDRRVLGTTNLEPPVTIDLPAGTAVRIRRHQFVRTDIATSTGVYTETFLVPHGDDEQRVCVLAFATMSDHLATDFSRLFVKIAETLRLFGEGDETLTTDGTATT